MSDSPSDPGSSGPSPSSSPSPGSALAPAAVLKDAVRCDLSLQNPNRYPEVKPAELGLWLAGLLAELEPRAGSLAVRFCGDRAMRRTNREYRGLDKTTDVLSFPGDLPPSRAAAALGLNPAPGKKGKAAPAFPVFAGDHLGDLLISLPQARRQAAELGHPLGQELRILLLHGVLHCLGFDHEADDGTMNRVEADLRRRYVGDLFFLEGSES